MEKDNYIENFSKNMKAIRTKNNISKKEMAKILVIGIGSLLKIENEILPPKLEANILIKIYNKFEILPSELFSKESFD
ncbi:MAG: helix-turn-helix transcriptional regulator [Ruminococcaceae bacterium]|nr:helix-turn-helix transcriptional regulator [Oscillospiraceae bacterium]